MSKKNNEEKRKENGRDGAQCSIRLSDLGPGQFTKVVRSVAGLRGVLRIDADPLNHLIVVNYEPQLVTFRQIQEMARREKQSRALA